MYVALIESLCSNKFVLFKDPSNHFLGLQQKTNSDPAGIHE